MHQPDLPAERDAVSQECARHQERELLSDFQPVVYSPQGRYELFPKGPGKTTKARNMLVTTLQFDGLELTPH